MEGFVVGVSGGIDSAVTSTLCAHTNKPVLCLEMPIHQAQDQVSRAQEHLAWLESTFPNVKAVRIDLTPLFDSFQHSLPKVDEAAADQHHSALQYVNALLFSSTSPLFGSRNWQ